MLETSTVDYTSPSCHAVIAAGRVLKLSFIAH